MSAAPSAVAAQPDKGEVATVQAKPSRKKGKVLRTVGWVSVGVGTAALLAGGSTLIASAGNRGKANNLCEGDACEGDDQDQFERLDKLAKTFRVPGYLGLSIGVAATGTGIALLVIAGKKNKLESNWSPAFRLGSVELTPLLSPQGASLVGRFEASARLTPPSLSRLYSLQEAGIANSTP